MKQSVTLVYGKQTIDITYVPPAPETKTPGVIEFELRGHRKRYIFSPAAWAIEHLAAFEHCHKLHYKKHGREAMFADSALDIVRGIMHVFYAYMSNCVNYAVYHLKHFPPTEGDNYDDVVMDTACHAMIDVDFFAGPKAVFQRVTLVNEGKNLTAFYAQ